MLVKNWMTQPVLSIDKNDTIGLANQLMSEKNIRALPVLFEGALVGIVTDRDLKKVSVSEKTGLNSPKVAYLNTRIKVRTIMTKNIITVQPNTTIDEVAKILLKKKISAVPVVNESNALVGIITLSDVFRFLISLTGIEAAGIQIAVEISTQIGTVKEVSDIVRSFGGRICNLLTSYDNVPAGYRHAYLKTYDVPSDKIDEMIKKLAEKVKVLFVIEHFGDETPPKVLLMNV